MNLHRFILAALLLASPAARALDHSGEQSGRWLAADSPHLVVADVVVPSGKSLEIDPGAVVLFAPGTGLSVEGALLAGGPGPRVLFTGDAPAPLPGDWDGINVHGTAELQGADVVAARAGLVVRPGALVDVVDSRFADSLLHGVTFAPAGTGILERSVLERNGMSGVLVARASPRVLGCRFTDNARPITLMGACSPDFQLLSADGNVEGDGIHVDVLTPLDGMSVWTDGGIPYLIPADSTLAISAPAQLSLGPGAIVKLGARSNVLVEGELFGGGTASRPCLLTSAADDLAGGDSNADGGASVPAKGDWSGVDVANNGLALLAATEIRLARDAIRAMPGSRVLMQRCNVHHSQDRGVAFGFAAEGVLKDCSIHDCDVGIQVFDASLVGIGRPGGGVDAGGSNVITCNVIFDVQSFDESVDLPAHRNWWGPLGPDPSKISGRVDTGLAAGGEPFAAAARRILRLSKPNRSDLLLTWTESSSCDAARVVAAPAPNGFFEEIGVADDERLPLALRFQPLGLRCYRVELD